MIVAEGDVDVCDYDPGFDVTATLSTSLRTLTRLWRGDLAWTDAIGGGLARVHGPEPVRRQVPTWIGQSTLAGVPRPA